MTDEEVKLIYNYLHENYRYEDGDLISKIDCGKRHTYEGHRPGTLKQESKTNIQIYMRVTINKKSYEHPMSFFIYLFHKKIWPERITFKDKNSLNTKIKNLILTTKKEMEHEKAILKKGYYKKISRTGKIKYQALLHTSIGFIYLGSYETENEASDIHKYAREKYIRCQNDKQIRAFKKNIIDEIYVKNSLRNKGYSWDKNAYQVKILHNKVLYQIGRYDTPEKAREAYLKAKESIRKNTFTIKKKIVNPLGTGVSKSRNKFKSTIRLDGKYIYLGTFNTPEKAHAAYLKAKEEYAKTQTIPDQSSN